MTVVLAGSVVCSLLDGTVTVAPSSCATFEPGGSVMKAVDVDRLLACIASAGNASVPDVPEKVFHVVPGGTLAELMATPSGFVRPPRVLT